MRLAVPLVLSLGFSLACAGLLGDGADEDNDGNGSGNSGPDDTDDTADTDDTDTTDGGGPCGPYAAIAEGRWWTYEYVGNDMVGTWTTTVEAFDGTAGTMTTEGEYAGNGFTQSMSTTMWFTCDGGPVTQRVETEYEGESSGYAYAGSSVTTYTDPQPNLPTALAVGDTWTVRYRGTTVTEGAAPYDFDFSTTYAVEEEDRVEVEAGAWNAFFVKSATDGEAGGGQWVARGVGAVEGTGFELVDWSE